MKQKYHTALIVFASVLFIGTLFLYFSHGISSEAADPTASSLVSSNGSGSVEPINAVSDNITAQTAFLANLSSLTHIKIDSTLFANPLFQALHDNSVAIETVVPGRPNPFAPVDPNAIASGSAPIVTSPATQITATSAVFNGTLNGPTPATSVYFEYGTTPTLGKTTAPVTQSLVSTFVTKVSGLTSGTTYFYRADAKINGVVSSGDIISFTTN